MQTTLKNRHDLHICIPTSNRADVIGTHESLPESWKKITTFYIPKDQVKDYKKVLKGWNIVAVPMSKEYIGCQRQWIMENRPARFIFFLDDDLSFSVRGPELKLKKCAKRDMGDMLSHVRHYLQNGYPVVSISPRFGNNRVEEPFQVNCRAHTAWALDGDLYEELGIRFDPIKPMVMEDFHVTLCFLEKGYQNVRLFNFCFNPLLESNADGGCSVWRTFEVHDNVTKWMEANHATFSRVYKKSKTGWNGFPEDEDGLRCRWDAKIGWKKAYKPKLDKTAGVSKFL